MADVYSEAFYWDTAQLLNDAADWWLSGTAGNPDTYSPFVFEDFGGYRSIVLTFFGETDNSIRRFINLELAAGETLSLRAFLQKPGLNAPLLSYWGLSVTYWASFADLMNDWASQVGLLWYEAIDTWTNGLADEPNEQAISYFGGQAATGRFSIPCFADTEATVLTLNLYAQLYDEELPSRYFAPPTGVNGYFTAPAAPGTAALLQVVQALQDIAHKTTVATLNNQGAIAVLDSSEVITP